MTSASMTRNKIEDRAGQAGADIKQKAQDVGPYAADKAKEAAENVADRAKDVADKAKDLAASAVTSVGQKAGDAVSAVGGGMKSLAETIRENAPNQGVLGNASSSVARALEQSGRHLQEDGLSGIGDDLTNLIRRNPVPSLLVGIGIGFLLARATRS